MTSVKMLSFKGLAASMGAILVASVMFSPTISESASRKGSGGRPILHPTAPKQPSARRSSTSPAPGPKSTGIVATGRRKGDGPKTQTCLAKCDRINAQCTSTLSGGILVENSTCWNYLANCVGKCRTRGG